MTYVAKTKSIGREGWRTQIFDSNDNIVWDWIWNPLSPADIPSSQFMVKFDPYETTERLAIINFKASTEYTRTTEFK